MLRLTLVRHAKSSWADPGTGDFERPLNKRGVRDAPVMALRMGELRRLPDLLVSSPALRAFTTAGVFAERLGFSVDAIRLEQRIYEASRETLAEVVRELDPTRRHAMLFGHNPGFCELARWLATCSFTDMPTCAIASIELQVGDWRELGPGCGKLVRYLYPKDGSD
jgi:phosphohistidine phosphatase